MKIKSKRILITSLLFSQILAFNSYTSHADSIILNKELTEGVNVRKDTDMNSEILGGIEDFGIYEIKDTKGSWYEIEFEGKTGYVGKDWFYRLSHTSLIDTTNLKEEADSDSSNLTEQKLLPKTKVTILEFLPDSDFVKVSYDPSFLDNKSINSVDLEKMEQEDFVNSLTDRDDSPVIKTITLSSNSQNTDIPSVVTLTGIPETVEINEDLTNSDDVKEPEVTGYVKLTSLAISKKDKTSLDEFIDTYNKMNEAINKRKEFEEAQRNQVREIQTLSYVTTTTYQVNENTTETSSNQNTIMVPVTGSEVGVDLYKWATQFVGRPYVLGGTSLTNGIDCSGFTMRIYQQIGIGLPHFAQSQQRYGVEIPFGSERAGDLVFFGTSLNNITHVGMADGNGNMIHASSPRVGIIISPIRNPISIKRIVQ